MMTPEERTRLERACETESGKLIINYLEERLSEIDYDNIDIGRETTEIGYQFIAHKIARDKIEQIMRVLKPH